MLSIGLVGVTAVVAVESDEEAAVALSLEVDFN